ncbi:dihydrofolate reductase [Devosia sp.]|uniref:dihydrofolate reductase n=1 Tax=Devosia sp. TaxID=1871048 RepID=UPI002EF519AB
MTVPVALIAAVAENGVIGSGNAIPWRLPSDFAFFKRMTVGKPVIMGRRTFESIGRPLPERVNIVVSRAKGYQPEGVLVIDSLEAALDHAQAIAQADGASEVMVAGGETIYRAALPLADRLYISHVALAPEGDAFFPPIDPAAWTVVDQPRVPPSARDSTTFRVDVYERR